PQGLVALHSAPPDERILDSVIERMADMQGSGDVRRGDDDGERGLVAGRVDTEQTGGYPLLVPPLLDIGGQVLSGQRFALLPAVVGLGGVGHPESLRPGVSATTLRGAP